MFYSMVFDKTVPILTSSASLSVPCLADHDTRLNSLTLLSQTLSSRSRATPGQTLKTKWQIFVSFECQAGTKITSRAFKSCQPESKIWFGKEKFLFTEKRRVLVKLQFIFISRGLFWPVAIFEKSSIFQWYPALALYRNNWPLGG